MASEDVLEMAENWVRVFEHRGSYPGDGYDGRDMVLALAAEVRKLRRDEARLDFVLRCGPILLVDTDESGRLRKSWDDIETREDIDAAMGGEG